MTRVASPLSEGNSGAQAPPQKPGSLAAAESKFSGDQTPQPPISVTVVEHEEPTPAQAAVAAVDGRLEKLWSEGGLLRGEEVQRFPHGTEVWGEGGGGGSRRDAGDFGADGVGAFAEAGVVEWAKRFEVGSSSPLMSVGAFGEELGRHLVRDGDAGLIGTR